jgi:hypothetical protein
MAGPYVPSGPFVNGGAPGINMGFLNNLEAWIKQMDANGTGITINGSTSGSATLYQPLQGSVKLAVVTLGNFRNGAAGDQNLALPTAFTAHMLGLTSDSGPFDLKSGGTNQTVWTHTALPGSAGATGSNASGTELNGISIFHCDTAFDAIGLWGSQSSGHTGMIVLFGV